MYDHSIPDSLRATVHPMNVSTVKSAAIPKERVELRLFVFLGGGFVSYRSSDPLEPGSLLLLNVRHTRRRTANQI